MPDTIDIIDLAIVGAGAAGLMAAISAGRAAKAASRPIRIVAFDGAKRLGAKILVSGGGRCNVTHDAVDAAAFAGSTPNAIKKVLRRFDVPQTVAFFRELGVQFKREETGKLFPTSDDARTILDALLRAASAAGVELRHPARVEQIRLIQQKPESASAPAPPIPIAAPTTDAAPAPTCFELNGPFGELRARRVVLATGGKSLPKTGSDGAGYELARRLHHTITPRILPALVPLVLDSSCFIRQLSGLTVPATLELRSGTRKRIIAFTDSTLCTHTGLSGPGVLDISRHFLDARLDDSAATLFINWLPGESPASLDAAFIERSARGERGGPAHVLAERLPQRLARALCHQAGIDPAVPFSSLARDGRRRLVAAVCEMPLPVVGDRGFAVAEVTAGGVPLRELHLDTMESRVCPGLYLCGEICDVDGRIGGYNFQWAWASGYVAGTAAARA